MSGFLDGIQYVELPPARSERSHRIREAVPKEKMSVINTGDGVQTVIWHVIKCPECGSTKVPVQHTNRPIRYHKCADCGETFKSVEKYVEQYKV